METRRSLSGGAEYLEDAREDHRGERRDSGVRVLDLGSGVELSASERPTAPPPGWRQAAEPSPAIVVARIQLHTSMDELLYRLAVGDWDGAHRASEELQHLVPRIVAGRVMLAATELDYLQEFVLAFVDGRSTWGEIVDGSPFGREETLRALCALVDAGIAACL